MVTDIVKMLQKPWIPTYFENCSFQVGLMELGYRVGGWGVNDQTVSVFKVETVHDIFFVVHVSWVFFLIFPPFSLLFLLEIKLFSFKMEQKIVKM